MGRLGNSQRRAAIIDAVLPLFARKGVAATTTKEIAQAAGVSEALIFKHFPSKAALYEAIFQSCVDGDEELARLLAMEPGTAALVAYVRAMVRHYVRDLPANRGGELARKRLILMSLLEDGEFARLAAHWASEQLCPCFVASLRAARDAGDLVPTALTDARPENAFWLSELLGSMVAAVRLPQTPVLPSLHDDERVSRQTVAFILRGLGLKDEVIAAHTSSDPTPADVQAAGAAADLQAADAAADLQAADAAADRETSCPRKADRDH